MIVFDLETVGRRGAFVSLFAIIIIYFLFVFFLPSTGESAIVWVFYLGIPYLLSKLGLVIFGIMWFVGLLMKKNERNK